jgi:ubiquinone/menaquinone biosynthesis C-methylase UbiE
MNTSDVKAFFDRVASDWDTMRIAYYDERVIDRLGDFAELTPDMVVADVGTGTGFVAAGIAPRVAQVIGIDISERILDVARRNLEELAIDNVELRVGDITEVEHPWKWMREEHADIWLGFTPEQVRAFFAAAGLESSSLESLGRQ